MPSKDCIVIHCSASDNKRHDNIETMRKWHKAKGWRDVGYMYYIRKNGMIQTGRHEHDVGAHTIGFNKRGIGICLGGLAKEKFTKEQFDACAKLCQELRTRHDIQSIFGHNMVAVKSCPVFNVMDEIYPRLYTERFQR